MAAAGLLLYPAGALTAAIISPPLRLDPAAWGSDHVGQAAPEYPSGDQCLFCHRLDVAPGWGKNAHNRTIRTAGEEAGIAALRAAPALRPFAEQTAYVLGGKRRLRFLKPAAAYGHLELLSVQWQPESHRLAGVENPHWNERRFGDSCTGCHATAVDPDSRAFAATAVDCGACHGMVEPGHSTDPKRALLSPRRRDPARVVVSICGSCHLRSGRSQSTGRPYANNFVPGDNLLRDFRVSFEERAVAGLNPADRHILETVREVAVLNRTEVTCLSCHEVHGGSTRRHRELARRPSCDTCHGPGRTILRKYEVHSATCGY